MKEYPLNKVIIYACRKLRKMPNSDSLSKIESKLVKAGFSKKVLKKEIPFIEKAVSSIISINSRPNPLRATVTASASVSMGCPLCPDSFASGKSSLTPVKLYGGREASFCVEHNVTLPSPIN